MYFDKYRAEPVRYKPFPYRAWPCAILGLDVLSSAVLDLGNHRLAMIGAVAVKESSVVGNYVIAGQTVRRRQYILTTFYTSLPPVAAPYTAGPTLATVCDPPDAGASGRPVSPSSDVTFDTVMPSAGGAICVVTA